MSGITYEKHNKKSFAVHGDKSRYASLIKSIGGRWNSRLKSGEGWTVPLERENDLKNLIEELQKNPNLKAPKKTPKTSVVPTTPSGLPNGLPNGDVAVVPNVVSSVVSNAVVPSVVSSVVSNTDIGIPSGTTPISEVVKKPVYHRAVSADSDDEIDTETPAVPI